jgi:hypothetical protein
MSEEKKGGSVGFWGGQLDQTADEIARLATICNVRILEAGVIERVIKGDASVCGTSNEKAFQKLRAVVGIHLAVRDKAAENVGDQATVQTMNAILEHLRKKYGDRFGQRPGLKP